MDSVLLGLGIDGLLLVMEQTVLPIPVMGLTGRVLEQVFFQVLDGMLLGMPDWVQSK
jgi:hypothetical protein